MVASAAFAAFPNLQIHRPLLRPSPPKSVKKTSSGKRNHDSFASHPAVPPKIHSSSSVAAAAAQAEAFPELHGPRPGTGRGELLDSSCPLRRLDAVAFSSLLKSCSRIRDVKRLHAVAVRAFDSSVTFVGNNLITAYARLRELDAARKLFDGMPVKNVISWTAMLHGCLNAGRDEDVLELFQGMIEEDVQANSLTFVCLLKSCGNRLDFELGKQIHACVVKGNWSNLIMDSALLYFYAQCGDLVCASRVFEGMAARDVVAWTTVISAYVQAGRGYEAFSLFTEMQNQGIYPNEFTVCSVLKACGDLKATGVGRQLHGALLKGMLKQDVYIGSSLVNMYVSCGEVLDARIVFELMPKRNTITWTSMISGYARNGDAEEAIFLFQKMKRRRVFANNLTIVSILRACGSEGLLYLGKEVHGQIIKNLVQSNVYIGSTLIWFYCKCGDYASAARVLESMPEKDVISWTAIISGYASLGHGSEALELLNNMLWEGVEPNPYTYSSALKACTQLEAVAYGKWIHASVNKTRALTNVFVGSALIDMYMRCGCISDALRVFETMPERNLVSWKMMVIGYAKNGLCKEALKLMYRMQEEGFHVDDYVQATVLGACGDVQSEFERPTASCLVSA